MAVGHRKTGRNFFAPHSVITDNEALTPEKTYTTKEEAMDEARANHYIACIMRMI
jgi:hypothetical protein